MIRPDLDAALQEKIRDLSLSIMMVTDALWSDVVIDVISNSREVAFYCEYVDSLTLTKSVVGRYSNKIRHELFDLSEDIVELVEKLCKANGSNVAFRVGVSQKGVISWLVRVNGNCVSKSSEVNL